MSRSTSPAVAKAATLKIRGTIVDDGWYSYIKYNNGKPNMNAVLILSEIVFWYRPEIKTDPETGNVVGYKKKFKADKLQKSYQDLGQRFGITKRQAKMACDLLEELGLITREFRTIDLGDRKLNNVMYVEPDIEKVESISCLYNIQEQEEEVIELTDKEKEIENLKKKLAELEKENAELKKNNPPAPPEEEDPAEPQLEEFKKLPREAIKLSLYLIDRIKKNFPQQPVPDTKIDDRNKKLLNWCKEIERLNRLGPPGGEKGYSWEQIRKILDWSQDSNFWKGNILSAGKLREKVVTLTAQMQRDNGSPPTGQGSRANLSQEILEIGMQLQSEMEGDDGGGEW